MQPSRVAILVATAIVLSVVGDSFARQEVYNHVIVESCRGCQLNRLPEVKAFIFEDLPLYDHVEFKHIQGAPPEMVFYNEADKEIERLALGTLTREECNDLLTMKGFEKSKTVRDEI